MSDVLESAASVTVPEALDTASHSAEVRTLAGKWSMRDWRHDHEDHDKAYTETSDAEIFQEEDGRVHGGFENKQGKYRFSGYLTKESTFTGTWGRDLKGVGGIAHGAFQFKILDHADRMLGLWVGIGNNGTRMNWGTWEWKRRGIQGFPSEIDEHSALLPSARSSWLEWSNLPIGGKVTIVAAVIAAFGVIIAAIIRALPELLK